MISLDKNILDKNSRVAQRMIEYGKEDELFIIIPGKEKKSLDLSLTVHVQSTGGSNKIVQFLRLFTLGQSTIKQWNNRTIEQLVTTQDPFFTGLVGWYLKKKFKISLEVQMHGDFFGGYYHGLKLCWAKFVLKRADVIRVVGERIKQSLIKFGIAESKIEIRPIFVDIERIKNYQPKFNLHQKYPGYEKIFLVLGRLDPVKNIAWLIDIFTQVIMEKSKYLLLVVGGGQEEQNYKLKIKNYKLLDNIQFESWTIDPISHLKTADCVLFPSLSEGYGLVPMETHAAGTPIIMSDVGVANYELKPSEKVKILPINDKNAWVKVILEV